MVGDASALLDEAPDSLSLFSRGHSRAASRQAQATANLMGALTIFLALYHWSISTPSPTGALDWAIPSFEEGQRSMPVPFGSVLGILQVNRVLASPMPLFALISGINDRRDGYAWKGVKSVLQMACGVVYLLHHSRLPVVLTDVYNWLWPEARGGGVCPRSMSSGNLWYLVTLAILKTLGFATAKAFGVDSRAPALLSLGVHFICFGEGFFWPFLRVPLHYDSWAASWLPSDNNGVVLLYPFYQAGVHLVPAAFPAELPGEQQARRLLQRCHSWISATRFRERAPRRNTVRSAASICIRIMWLLLPSLLRPYISADWGLASERPYSLTDCPIAASKTGAIIRFDKACLRRTLLHPGCVWNQWRLVKAAEDAGGLLVLMSLACSLAALAPRRRVPLLTEIGANSLLLYVCSHFLMMFLAPLFERYLSTLASGLLNALANAGLVPLSHQQVSYVLINTALMAAVTCTFWLFVQTAERAGNGLAIVWRVSSSAARYVAKAAKKAEPRGEYTALPDQELIGQPLPRRVGRTRGMRLLWLAAAMALLAAGYDGTVSKCAYYHRGSLQVSPRYFSSRQPSAWWQCRPSSSASTNVSAPAQASRRHEWWDRERGMGKGRGGKGSKWWDRERGMGKGRGGMGKGKGKGVLAWARGVARNVSSGGVAARGVSRRMEARGVSSGGVAARGVSRRMEARGVVL